MLQTRFPRLPGDIGNPLSFRLPVRYALVEGASAQRVVRERAAGLLEPFIDAARVLVADGAAAIATGCGFLALFQRELTAALPVPVWTSSLLKLRELKAPGVVTVDAAALTRDHLLAAGADPATPVAGLAPGCSLRRTLLDDLPTLAAGAAQADTVAAALALCERHPHLSDMVFECTNLPPYADAVHRATGLPVHHAVGFLCERWAALGPNR